MVPEAMSNAHQIVFVVDEDLAVRDSLVFALGLEGFSVRACGSGAELLRHLDLLPAGCLVIEDKMLEMDGFEVLAFLASRDLKVPVIPLTSHSTAAIRKRAALAGCTTSSKSRSSTDRSSIVFTRSFPMPCSQGR